MSLLYQNLSADQAVFDACASELKRQRNSICLIASENLAPKSVMQAYATAFTNKYAEGNVKKRFYEGCEVIDEIEELCIQRACALFRMKYANVQPHSGSQANQAVMAAVLNPKDTILGLDLGSGGHLTHGFRLNTSGKFYNALQYVVDEKTHLIDYDQVYQLAQDHCPKLIIAGASSYSRLIHWDKMRLIADEVGAVLVADMAHIAGLVAAGIIPSPADYADIITSTTHKTLRGPRGGLILTNNPDLMKKINSAVMPGVQGGPLIHVIAAKAVAFEQAASAEFRQYALQTMKNMKVMEKVFVNAGLEVVSGGTDTHMLVVNVTALGLTGKQASTLLAKHNIVLNYNAVPFETRALNETSGIRIGTPFITSCGFDEKDVELLANVILRLLSKQISSVEQIKHLFTKVNQTYDEIFDDQPYV